jgi:YidC/Oxa1 family membrane protein insertase
MIHTIWNLLLYKPIVNALALLVSIVPGGDVGVAVILITLLVKTLLFPLSQRSIESQAKMNLLAPQLKKIKESGASKEEQAKLTMELYRNNKTNPFSGCLLILIQIPIIFALYYAFLKGIKFDPESLYSFIHAPAHINMNFLGILDIGSKSAVLAVLAGISQYLQAHYMPKPPVSTSSGSSFQESFSKSMNMQMKYVFPFLVAFIAYGISGAVALYWITSNMFMVGQQIYINKKKTQDLVIK